MNSKIAWWIVDQLVQQGVRSFCIAPGSRSTPLALAAAHHPKAKIYVHFDERALSFFALGIGLGSQVPAAVIATSGTAVGNLLPSVMEAYHSSTPLLLLTADRPPELIGAGANQATDQLKIFGNFVRGQFALPAADLTVSESYIRSTLAQAYCLTQETPGPIHVNWHIREPLFVPPFPSLAEGKKIEIRLAQKGLAEPIALSGLGAIYIGKLPSPSDLSPILALAAKLQWPIFADLLSQARLISTPEQVRHFDFIAKEKKYPLLETILHFGDRMTSKSLLSLRAKRHIHVSPSTALQDPNRTLTDRIIADPASFCRGTYTLQTDPSWLASWKQLDQEIEERLEHFFTTTALCTESHAARAWSALLDPNWAVFTGSGMPIREADQFLFPRDLKGFYANRGLSGIDGNIATAAGLSIGLNAPVAIWIGDQAALHDLNSLSLLTQSPHPLALLVSNNFGGGIFSHLPIARASAHFERLFANAHTWEFSDAAQMFNLPYRRVETIDAFKKAWREMTEQSSVIELITSRTTNYEFHLKCQLPSSFSTVS